MPATVSVLQGARNVRMDGGAINVAGGNMIINDTNRPTKNYGSHNTTNWTSNNSNNDRSVNDFSTHTTTNFRAGTVNNIGNAKNVNTGTNYGTVNQGDNRGAVPSWDRDINTPRGYDPQRGKGQGPRIRAEEDFQGGMVNNIDSAKNVNTGDNYGTINQSDNRGAIPSWIHDNNAQRGYDHQRGGSQPFRPPYRQAYSGPASGPPYNWYEEPQVYGRPSNRPPFPHAYSGQAGGPASWQDPRPYGGPQFQPPYPARPSGFPPGNLQYQNPGPYGPPLQGPNSYHPGIQPLDPRNAEILRTNMERLSMEGGYPGEGDGEDADEVDPWWETMPLDEPTTPSTIASSNASAQGVSSPSRKKKYPFTNILSKHKDHS